MILTLVDRLLEYGVDFGIYWSPVFLIRVATTMLCLLHFRKRSANSHLGAILLPPPAVPAEGGGVEEEGCQN